MTRTVLSAQQRQRIADHYLFAASTQEETAKAFNVSRRTVQRILLEKGLIQPTNRVSHTKRQLLDVVAKHQIGDADTLDKALGMIPLTPGNVHRYLASLPADEMLALMYGCIRQQTINNIHQSAQQQLQERQAANGGEMHQEALV